MPLDCLEICRVANARLSPKGQELGVLLPIVRANLPAALNMLGSQVAAGPDRRLLQKDFSLAIDIPTQTVDLTPSLNAPEPMLVPHSQSGNFIAFPECMIGGVRLYQVADRRALARQNFYDGRAYYCIQGLTMYLGGGPFSGNFDALANYIPTINQTVNGSGQVTAESVNMPTELSDDLVAAVVQVYQSAQMQQGQQGQAA